MREESAQEGRKSNEPVARTMHFNFSLPVVLRLLSKTCFEFFCYSIIPFRVLQDPVPGILITMYEVASNTMLIPKPIPYVVPPNTPTGT